MTKFSQKRFSVFLSQAAGTRRTERHCPRCGGEGLPIDAMKGTERASGKEKLVCVRGRCNTTWYIRRRKP